MCSEAYVRTGKSFDVIEKELLKGQSEFGCRPVFPFLSFPSLPLPLPSSLIRLLFFILVFRASRNLHRPRDPRLPQVEEQSRGVSRFSVSS